MKKICIGFELGAAEMIDADGTNGLWRPPQDFKFQNYLFSLWQTCMEMKRLAGNY